MSAQVLELEVAMYKPYGQETFYPKCEVSRLFAKLLRQKTLTRRDLEGIKKLGYTIKTMEVVV